MGVKKGQCEGKLCRDIVSLTREGLSVHQVCKKLKIGRETFYRLSKESATGPNSMNIDNWLSRKLI